MTYFRTIKVWKLKRIIIVLCLSLIVRFELPARAEYPLEEIAFKEEPKPIKMAKIGEKLDFFGNTFGVYEDNGIIHYTYLDSIESVIIEGNITEAWEGMPVRRRNVELDYIWGPATSFLVFERRDGVTDRMAYTVDEFIFWSRETKKWKRLPAILGPSHNVQPVVNQLAGSGYFYFWSTKLPGRDGVSYYQMNFEEERLEELFSLSRNPADGNRWDAWEIEWDRWGIIGKWNETAVLGKTGFHVYTRGEIERTGSRWDFFEFDLGIGSIRNRIAPGLITNNLTHHARFVALADELTVVLGDRRGGVTVCRFIDGLWEARKLEYRNVQHLPMGANPVQRLNMPHHGNLDVVEAMGKLFLVYGSDDGVFLQVWDSGMREFTEYWMGDFGTGSGSPLKVLVMDSNRLVTFSKDNPRAYEEIKEHMDDIEDTEPYFIVDLVMREWEVEQLTKIREGRIDNLEVVEVGTVHVDNEK